MFQTITSSAESTVYTFTKAYSSANLLSSGRPGSIHPALEVSVCSALKVTIWVSKTNDLGDGSCWSVAEGGPIVDPFAERIGTFGSEYINEQEVASKGT